jgi:hypothetical protein
MRTDEPPGGATGAVTAQQSRQAARGHEPPPRRWPPCELTFTLARDTVEGTDVRHLSLYLPGMTEPGA